MSAARFIRICLSATIGEHPIARTKRAINADWLKLAFHANGMIERSAAGRAVVFARVFSRRIRVSS
jgi:hypothetical protein